MNDDAPEDRFPSDANRGRARERMSADYDDTPPRRSPAAGRTAPPAGGAVSQALSQFLNSDTGTRRLVYGAAGLGGLLLVGIGGWALVGHHQSGIPVLGPPPVAMRTKPVDPGGMQLDGVTMPEADDGQAHPVPAPEKPNPTALAAQYGQEAAKTDAATTAAAGAQPQAATTAAAGTAGQGGADSAAKGAEGQGGPTSPDGQAPAQAGADVAQPTTLPEAGSGSDDDSAAGDTAAAAAPPAAPARTVTPPKAVAKAPVAAAPSAPAKAVAEQLPPPSPVPAPTGGKYRVQLAALQSDAQAQQEWSRLKTRYPALFGDRTPVVEKIQRDNAVFYRLRVGGFASTAETRAFCSAVRERGLACAQVHQ
ncbi:SPOR domain-containing protein [Acetobacter orientalis]|uniref:SPOR domain-containing protein n=1 Tax=Acetobacter orientalis TaxID=146474 RepID=UPI0039E94CC8